MKVFFLFSSLGWLDIICQSTLDFKLIWLILSIFFTPPLI